LLSAGASRGLWDRCLGIAVRLVGARHPVLDRLRMPAPAAGPSRNGADHEGGFTMTLAHGTDRLESARLVLRRVVPDDLPFYTRDPAVWGQGFATEAARCVRDYARDVLRLSYAISAILPQNARSRRVAERSGARVAGQMEVLGLTWDRYVWPLATGGAPQPPP